MCNLYNITTSQEAIRQWTRLARHAGNLEPSIDIYPQPARPCGSQRA
jgi:putative SOS response-associated peptidase YedK